MAKVKTTYEAMLAFSQIAQLWASAKDENVKTKLGYAIQRINPRIKKLAERYQNKRADIEIDCCETDERGIILRDKESGQYLYKKDGQKRRNEAWQELYESEIEIEPYYATKLPDDLTALEIEAFCGFVISPAEAEAAFGRLEGDDGKVESVESQSTVN